MHWTRVHPGKLVFYRGGTEHRYPRPFCRNSSFPWRVERVTNKDRIKMESNKWRRKAQTLGNNNDDGKKNSRRGSSDFEPISNQPGSKIRTWKRTGQGTNRERAAWRQLIPCARRQKVSILFLVVSQSIMASQKDPHNLSLLHLASGQRTSQKLSLWWNDDTPQEDSHKV